MITMDPTEAKRIVAEHEHDLLWSLRRAFGNNAVQMADELRRQARRIDQVADHIEPSQPEAARERHDYAARLRRVAEALVASSCADMTARRSCKLDNYPGEATFAAFGICAGDPRELGHGALNKFAAGRHATNR
jgi:hypothetical protein